MNSQTLTRRIAKQMPGQGFRMAGSNNAFNQSPEPIQGNPAPLKQSSHLRACTECVRAKAKCSVGVDIKGNCERYGLINNTIAAIIMSY
jgi:hypothetical protein